MRHIDGELPADFPLGYHWLQSAEGRRRRLIVSPGRCWLPDDRAWGWAVQLYATRSRASWGIGDLADLRAVRRMAADQGAGFVLINPLHAVAPTPGQEASPYLPATRRFRNPIYLRVAEVPGADGVDLEDDAGRALSDGTADRPRRHLGPQARGADAHLLRPRRRRGVRPLARGAGADAAGLGDLGRDRRGARRRLAHLARGAAPSRRARSSTATSSSTAPSSPSTPGCSGRWTCSSPPRPAT